MNNALRAAGLVLALGLSGCGGGGGSISSPAPATNSPPTANFAFTCADLVCNFTSTSTDQDVGDAIVAHSWSFGDGTTVPVTAATTSHSFAGAGSFDVTLMVADRSNSIGTVVRQVATSAPAAPAAPHAAFTASCASLDCTFTDTSSYDAGSAFQSRTWDFGDGATLVGTNPVTHRYGATTLTTYRVSLTVVDTAGKTSTSSQSLVTAPPATTLNCTAGNCTLALTQASRVTATLVSHSCSAQQNRVTITAPVSQTIFADGCTDPVGTVVAVNGGSTFAAGTMLEFAVLSGAFQQASLAFAPSIRVSGDFASGWTLTFDDGYGGAGEPDFNDLVVLIRAAP